MKNEKLTSSENTSLDCFFNMNNRLRELFEIKSELDSLLKDSDSIKLSRKLHSAVAKMDSLEKDLQSIKAMMH